jgi:tripartite-type tricarboxylate transporter receptor subunit TctC
MHRRTCLTIAAALAAAAATISAPSAFAQAFPSKPVRVVVPFTPGSATDILGRAVSEKLAAALGQPFIVENRPGAGGTIGIGQVAKSPADGYTVVVVSSGHVVNPVLYAGLPYENKDLVGIAPLATLPSVLIVNPDVGVKTVKDLVAKMKAEPGKLNYATAGIGSAAHVNTEKFKAGVGFVAEHIPLKGTPEILAEVASGRVQWALVPLVSSIPVIQGGKVMALAVATPKRSPRLPDVPTMAEAGFPGGEYNFWVGVLAPAGTPKDIVDKLNAEMIKAMEMPDVRERIAKLGVEPMTMSPAQFDALILEEARVLGPIMKAAGVKGG